MLPLHISLNMTYIEKIKKYDDKRVSKVSESLILSELETQNEQ